MWALGTSRAMQFVGQSCWPQAACLTGAALGPSMHGEGLGTVFRLVLYTEQGGNVQLGGGTLQQPEVTATNDDEDGVECRQVR